MAPGSLLRPWQYHGTAMDLPWYHRTSRHPPRKARRLPQTPRIALPHHQHF